MDDEGVGIVSASPQKKDGRVWIRAGNSRRKPIATQIGAVCSELVLPVADPLDPKSQVVGVKERVLRAPPQGDPTWLVEFKEFVSNWLDKHLYLLEKFVPSKNETFEELSFDDWLDNARYTQVRKNQLRKEYANGPQPSTWHKCKSFIKREFYVEFKDPRTINSRVDNYKVFAGPWVSAIEKDFTHRCKSFVKGMTPQDRAERAYERVRGALVMFNTDFSRYESQMTHFIIKHIECQLYRRYGMPEVLLKPLYGVNKCSMTGCSYEVRATRMSGDMNTSLGNGFVNLMVNKFVAHKVGARIRGVVEGDDGLFACYGTFPTAEDYAKLGFKITILPMDVISDGDFCSAKIFELAPDRIWALQDPRRVLLKAGWSFTCPDKAPKHIRDELMVAKAMSIASNCPYCPLLCAYCTKYCGEALLSSNESRTLDDTEYWYKRSFAKEDVLQPTDATRKIFHEIYGMPVAKQVECERYIETHDDLDHPDLLSFLGDYSTSAHMFAKRYMC